MGKRKGSKKLADVIPIDRPIQDMGRMIEDELDREERELGPKHARRPEEWVPKVLKEGESMTWPEIIDRILQAHGVRLEPQGLLHFLKVHCKQTGFGPSAVYTPNPGYGRKSLFT